MKPDGADAWAFTPGENEIKIARSFFLFNITNSEEILNNGIGKLIEMPPASFQEYAQLKNWEYQNISGNSFGQDEAEDYVAFNSETLIKSIPNNTTDVPYDAPITMVNFLTYITFYSFTHSPIPIYMIPALYDVVGALESDFFTMILAYAAWEKHLKNFTYVDENLAPLGFNSSEIFLDSEYGWGQWETLRPWVQSLLDYNATKQINAFENIWMHFQVEGLIELIEEGSLLYNLVRIIQEDMIGRYGTDDKIQLGLMQWAKGTVTMDLPLGLGTLNIPNTFPLPSFLQLNSTFTFIPEVYFLQLAVAPSKVQDFSPLAAKLLEISNVYPRTNFQSLLNLNNLALLFANPAAAASYFGFANSQQIENIKTYLGSLIITPVPAFNVTYDGYSLFLGKLTTKSIVSNTVKLRNDAYWSVPTLLVFAKFKELKLDCIDWVGAYANATEICNSPIGWTTQTPSSWQKFQIWVKAAFKNSTSQEYISLSQTVPPASLQELLYSSTNNLLSFTSEAMVNTSVHFACAKQYCNYNELFHLQWSTSNITNNAPDEVYTMMPKTTTMQLWTGTYSVPIEWSYYFPQIPVELAGSFLSYDGFLNPGIIRYFYNTYFQGNNTSTQEKFKLPSVEYVEKVYQYFLKIIPGLSFFKTMPLKSWLYGYYDYFVGFVSSMSIYEGGLPSLSPFSGIAVNSTDGNKPKHVVKSGRLDTSVTKNYYKYYNSTILNKYGASYDEYSPTMTSYKYSKIWTEDIELQGGDGGQYGTQISDKDILPVFISAILRYVTLSYQKDDTYHGLDVSHFSTTDGLMNTSATVEENAKFSQYPNGYDGFINISSSYGCPAFINFMHCFQCSNEAQDMFEYYQYSTDSYLTDRITPQPSDQAFADIEPLTGTGVRVFLNFEFRLGFYNDYFFKGFKEPVPGKGVYFPVYIFKRFAGLTQSQISKFFGDLKFIQELRRTLFYIGIIVGAGFIIFALIVGALIYRKHKFGSWKSPKNTMVQKYKHLKTKKEMI